VKICFYPLFDEYKSVRNWKEDKWIISWSFLIKPIFWNEHFSSGKECENQKISSSKIIFFSLNIALQKKNPFSSKILNQYPFFLNNQYYCSNLHEKSYQNPQSISLNCEFKNFFHSLRASSFHLHANPYLISCRLFRS